MAGAGLLDPNTLTHELVQNRIDNEGNSQQSDQCKWHDTAHRESEPNSSLTFGYAVFTDRHPTTLFRLAVWAQLVSH
jgi:hypothetical protein